MSTMWASVPFFYSLVPTHGAHYLLPLASQPLQWEYKQIQMFPLALITTENFPKRQMESLHFQEGSTNSPAVPSQPVNSREKMGDWKEPFASFNQSHTVCASVALQFQRAGIHTQTEWDLRREAFSFIFMTCISPEFNLPSPDENLDKVII